MPEIDRLSSCRLTVKIRPDIPVILCTGHSDVTSPDKAKKIGIKKYLTKPLVKQDLARAVRKVLDESKTIAEIKSIWRSFSGSRIVPRTRAHVPARYARFSVFVVPCARDRPDIRRDVRL